MLEEWYDILDDCGELIIDGIPDLKETIKLLDNRIYDNRWVMNLIYGSQKNQFSFHKWGYTYDDLRATLMDIGFVEVFRFNEIKHKYPTFGIRAVK